MIQEIRRKNEFDFLELLKKFRIFNYKLRALFMLIDIDICTYCDSVDFNLKVFYMLTLISLNMLTAILRFSHVK